VTGAVVYDDPATTRPTAPTWTGRNGTGRTLDQRVTVRSTIQQAIGIIIAKNHSTPDHAYTTLLLRAADAEARLLVIANAVIAGESP
jgi:AmiR/NasT family two-component response regulator